MNYIWDVLLFTKAIAKSPKAYGSLKGVFCAVSSLAVIMIDQWGGTLSLDSPPAPMLMCIGVYSLQAFFVILFRLFN